jgi:hypothetical protein
MLRNPNRMVWVSGTVESVDLQHHTISLWLEEDQFDAPQKIALTASIPQWMRFPGVPFSTHLPRFCLDAGNVQGVTWGAFLSDGMEYWTEGETCWQMGQIFQLVAHRPCDEEIPDGPANTCASDLRHLLEELLKLHHSHTWPILPVSSASPLEHAVQELRGAIMQAFQSLKDEYPALHTLCEEALRSHNPENEDDFTGASDQQRLHAWISQLLNCEADSVILARLLMEIYPDQARRLQTLIEHYHQQTPSPLATMVEEAEPDELTLNHSIHLFTMKPPVAQLWRLFLCFLKGAFLWQPSFFP